MHWLSATKTKNLRRARKRSISRSMIWHVHAPPANHNYTDLSLRLWFTRTYDPYQELPYYSFEECLAAALLVRFNKTLPTRSAESPPPPRASVESPLPPPPRESTAARGRGSHDVHAEWRKAAGVRREGKSFNSG
jgi:hypothetical protein